MLKKIWDFIKDNIAVIISLLAATLAVIYAVLRFFVYIFWKGYFTRLNIDSSLMNLNFDNSIFFVILSSIILFIVLLFMAWVYCVLIDIGKKISEIQIKGFQKVYFYLKNGSKGFFLSFVILFLANISVVIFLISLSETSVSVSSFYGIFFLLYLIEMLLIFTHIVSRKRNDKKNTKIENVITVKVYEFLVFSSIIMAIVFYSGSRRIERCQHFQLVQNQEYVITYNDGTHYVLHKIDYNNEEIVIYKNEQKIIDINNCEISVKRISNVRIVD